MAFPALSRLLSHSTNSKFDTLLLNIKIYSLEGCNIRRGEYYHHESE